MGFRDDEDMHEESVFTYLFRQVFCIKLLNYASVIILKAHAADLIKSRVHTGDCSGA